MDRLFHNHNWLWTGCSITTHNTGYSITIIDIFKLVLEKTLESSLDSKDIKPVNPKGNQP